MLEYENLLMSRLDNIDYLIETAIAEINADASLIGSTITESADNVGYTLSDSMQTIWNDSTASINGVITMYGDQFSSAQTSTNTALGNIQTGINSMISQLSTIAQQKIAEANKSAAEDKPQANAKPSTSNNKSQSSTTTTNENKSDSNDKKESEKKITNDTLMGIAAAIWNYQKENYGGWGANPSRKKKLTDKLGAENAAKVQQYINSYGANGKLYSFWISKGKNLNDYKYSAFKLGAKDIDETQLAWTQEQGQEYIVRPSDGAILTPIAKGDSVLNAQASSNIWKMANNPAEFVKDNLNLGTTNVPNNSTIQNSVTQNFDKIVFSMPNVHNYNEMLTQMQRDPNFERLVESMSIGKLAGGSSLAKGKAIR